ncbi:MAG: hypothetical protein ACKVJF_04400 [Flavobacteriales bacterium]
MYYRFLSYLNFLWHSKNEHGVHSPFIFKYVTQCLYAKKNHTNQNTWNVVLKSLAYFQCQGITIVPSNPGFESKVKNVFPAISVDSMSVELIYISDFTEVELKTYLYNNKKIRNDTVVILGNIYKNRNSVILWNKLKASRKVKVTVDMYHCAALFFRQEQVEEHFKIRI